MSSIVDAGGRPGPQHHPERRGTRAGIVLSNPVQDEAGELAAYFSLLRDHWRAVAAIFAVVFMGAALVALLSPPVFEASMLIYVEEATPSTSRNALNDVASMFDTKKAASAEMELLRSRAVAAATVQRLHLDIDTADDGVPLLGAWLRGRQSIEVDELHIPAAWAGRSLRLTLLEGEGGHYLLSEPRSGLTAQGRVGQTLRILTGAGPLSVRVARIHGAAGARFRLSRGATMAAIATLQRDLKIGEQGRQSGIIDVRFEAASPELAHAVLQEVGRQYLAQNLRHKREEAEKSLTFLDAQLPKLKARLEQAESDYNAFRHAHGMVDFAEEARLSLNQAATAQTRREELVRRRTELLSRFTARHPMVTAVTGQIADIDRQQARSAAHIRELPQLEQVAGRLSRDVKVNLELYTALANTAQQQRIVSVGKVGNVRMVDAPMVDGEPVRPHRKAILACGALIGLLAGLTAVLLRKNFAATVDDPLRIESLLGARVVSVSIPHSATQASVARQRARTGKPYLLARDAPADGAIEALRSFRASLRFSMPNYDNNVIMFAGPTSGMGKSFVSANFAAVVAASGKRVLMIDADLRNGGLHRLFGVPRGEGLCEAASGAIAPGQALVREVLPRLDLMTTGSLALERPGAVLPLHLQIHFQTVLDALRAQYDLVLVDSPPVLALADPLVIGAHAGAVFLVVRAGRSTSREIAEAVKRLNQAGIAPAGIVFNDVKPRLSHYGYKYAYRHAGPVEFSA
jgi:tyrosine-protein kinase Etk/Wzc